MLDRWIDKAAAFEVQYPNDKKVTYENPAQINFDKAVRIVVILRKGKMMNVADGKWAEANRIVIKD